MIPFLVLISILLLFSIIIGLLILLKISNSSDKNTIIEQPVTTKFITTKSDELSIYRGYDYHINDFISVHLPTLGEIQLYGEEKYFQLVRNIIATPTDMKYMLSTINIDWNECDDFTLFLILYRSISQEDVTILFNDLNLLDYEIFTNQENGETVLYNPKTQNIIDRSIYELITNYLRKAHGFEKNVEKAMTETTRIVLLEEAKEQWESSKDKEYKSFLLPLISTMINMEGFNYNHETIWNMKINAFMDSVKRIQNIKNANLLLSSGYSGFGIDLSKINKKELNYFRELEY